MIDWYRRRGSRGARGATAGVAAALLLCAAGVAWARRPPKRSERYVFEVSEVSATAKAPAEVSVKARAVLEQIIDARPGDFVRLDGAPDPATEPRAFKRYLAAHRLRAFRVKVSIDAFERALGPAREPGQRGQVLTLTVGVSLVGTTIPGGSLALAGSGHSTVLAEVGKRLRPREEENALDDALRDALTHAVDDAVTRLRAPAKRPARRARPAR